MDLFDGETTEAGAAGESEGGTGPGREARRSGGPRPQRRYLILAGGVALVVAGAAGGVAVPRESGRQGAVLVSKQSGAAAPGAQITVTGAATVQGTPDTVSFQIGVHTTGSNATTALAKNNSEVTSLEAALESHGVSASEMKTSQLDIYANTSSSGKVTGFSVDNDVEVTMHQVSTAGTALDAAAGSVGNAVNLYGISFSISNTSGLLATARAEAMQNARTEAMQLANGAGATLGPIVRVTDQENAQPSYFYGAALGAAAPSASVPLQRGTQPISVQVSVVYSLQN